MSELREQVVALRDRLRNLPAGDNSNEAQAARKLLTNLNLFLQRTSDTGEAQRHIDVTG